MLVCGLAHWIRFSHVGHSVTVSALAFYHGLRRAHYLNSWVLDLFSLQTVLTVSRSHGVVWQRWKWDKLTVRILLEKIQVGIDLNGCGCSGKPATALLLKFNSNRKNKTQTMAPHKNYHFKSSKEGSSLSHLLLFFFFYFSVSRNQCGDSGVLCQSGPLTILQRTGIFFFYIYL